MILLNHTKDVRFFLHVLQKITQKKAQMIKNTIRAIISFSIFFFVYRPEVNFC